MQSSCQLPVAGCQSPVRGRRGFTLIELLVVVGVIAILLGITIPVVSHVRKAAYRTDSANQISVIQGAINAYFGIFQAYPGPVSNAELYGAGATTYMGDTSTTGGQRITMAENLVIGLLGGARPGPKEKWIPDPTLVGTGPRSLNKANPKVYEPFLNKTDGWLSTGKFKDNLGVSPCQDTPMPEFIDRYPSDPMPILYLRATKGAAGIISNETPSAGLDHQYSQLQIFRYVGGQGSGGPTKINGVLQAKSGHGLFAWGHASDQASAGPNDALPYFKDPNASENVGLTDSTEARGVPRAKDGFILISAGPDRIYGTADDITTFGDVAK